VIFSVILITHFCTPVEKSESQPITAMAGNVNNETNSYYPNTTEQTFTSSDQGDTEQIFDTNSVLSFEDQHTSYPSNMLTLEAS
jgi:hypothetical protein